jgi:CTP:phosphocholine cytidylyltransferase-like protein/thiamine kinase-like enzyme
LLNANEFTVLNTIRKAEAAGTVLDSQREIAVVSGLSLGTVNTTVNELTARKYLSVSEKGTRLAPSGFKALRPYRVDNAIILAAGTSSRFVPISYEKPKGTLSVKGEVLIERLIRQLKEANITAITVVIGYMKEQFLYLEDTFGVDLIVNDVFAERNNNSSLKLVTDRLANSYIVTSDSYFTQNVFEEYVYKAYYASVFIEGPTDEYCLRTGPKGRIIKVNYGGSDEWVMFGQAYFDRAFSRRFVELLNKIYDVPETKSKLWEGIYAEHVKDFDMEIRKYSDGIIYEFDSLDELREFDEDFVTNIDSTVLDNICQTLDCERHQIRQMRPIEAGLSNFSFYFKVSGKKTGEYVYRHPGAATQGILNRAVEAEVETIAKQLGLDDTFIYQDPHIGWKISRFIHIDEDFDYHNEHHVDTALEIIKKLHNSGEVVNNRFDLFEETQNIINKLRSSKQLDFPDFQALNERAERLAAYVRQDPHICLCHNDFYDPNILISDDTFFLIDWEYTGMTDFASDLGTFISCSDYSYEQALSVLEKYFGRPLTSSELAHCMAYVSLAGYYWFIWALNKEAANESVGEWLHLWYRYAKEYGFIAEELIAKAPSQPQTQFMTQIFSQTQVLHTTPHPQ